MPDTASELTDIRRGPYLGVSDGEVAIFNSIPYASAPSPFEPSELIDAPTDVVDAREFYRGDFLVSVTMPHDAKPLDDLPVVVYIHGGRFEHGSHGDRRADGRANAQAGIVTVRIGYRVKLPGFAVFHDDEPWHFRGIDDCQVALNWVQRTIETFGGDPTNVTLIGQSAGATTALWLMRRDHYQGTFRRVIAMSPCFPRRSFRHRRGLLRWFLGAPVTRAGLSRLSTRRLESAYKKFRSVLFLDMALGPCPLVPEEMVDLPLVLTSTQDEFTRVGPTWANGSRGRVRLLARHMGLTGDFGRWYDAAMEIDDRPFGRMVGDTQIRRWISRLGERYPGTDKWMAEVINSRSIAEHSADIRPIFGAAEVPGGNGEDGNSDRVGLHALLVRFAHGKMPDWPTYDPESGRIARRYDLAGSAVGTTPPVALVEDPLKMVREAFSD